MEKLATSMLHNASLLAAVSQDTHLHEEVLAAQLAGVTSV